MIELNKFYQIYEPGSVIQMQLVQIIEFKPKAKGFE
jgi:hypothetical protein